MPIEIVHALPGRLRLRIGQLKADPERARTLQAKLASASGVRQVRASSLTGSLLLHYETARQGEVFDFLQQLFPEFRAPQPRGPQRCADDRPPGANVSSLDGAPSRAVAAGVATLFERFNKQVERQTGIVDLRVLLPFFFVALGFSSLGLSLLRRQRPALPNWYDFLWFSFNTFIALNVPVEGTVKETEESPSPEAANGRA